MAQNSQDALHAAPSLHEAAPALPIPAKEDLKFVVLHNFSMEEISSVLSAVKALYPDKAERRKLVFTKTTPTSLKMKVSLLIQDSGEDHLYLLENPPTKQQRIDENARQANEKASAKPAA